MTFASLAIPKCFHIHTSTNNSLFHFHAHLSTTNGKRNILTVGVSKSLPRTPINSHHSQYSIHRILHAKALSVGFILNKISSGM